MVERRDVRDIMRKFGAKIDKQLNQHNRDYSREYETFRGEWSPELSRYEQLCNGFGSLIKVNVSEKDEVSVKKYLKIAHLNVEPWQAVTLALISFLGVFFLGFLISVGVAFVKSSSQGGILSNFLSNFPFVFFFLSVILSLFLFYFVKGYPERLANKWRLKASSQMVPAILYVVVYMRHTPNLEKAIAFAAKNLEAPLSTDFKKIFYDVEVGKFSTMKESLDNYLETWRDYSPEFIESFHLIEGSLFEPDDARRVLMLEKSLQVVLDGVYDKMLKFSHSVRSPLTNVYMLGVVLPTLGLALLPLASALLGGLLKAYHVFVLYNLIIPFFVFYLTDKIIFLRPGGYGQTEMVERNPGYGAFKSKAPYFKAFFLCLPLFLIGLLPLILGFTPVPDALGIQKDFSFADIGLGVFGDEMFFGFSDGGIFGIGSIILGMFFPLGIALFFSIAFKEKTRSLIKGRNATEELENEFNNSLFQLGNRIGNGMPPELAFGKVAEMSRGLQTENFFRKVNYNVQSMGMGLESAIFDKNRGALLYYPSRLISTSMKILIESAKKGLRIAASSLMSISQYVKNIGKINQRLKDLLAEIASDMKSNMTFLAPLLSGVVTGLAAMIVTILWRLETILRDVGEVGTSFGSLTNLAGDDGIFQVTQMIPAYFLQLIIGLYLIQIVFILTRTLIIVDSGEDKLKRVSEVGKNLKRSVLLYFVVALLSSIVLYVLASVVLRGL